MRPIYNQTVRPHTSAKAHYTYNAAKVIARNLKPICQNEYKMGDTQSFPSMLKEQTTLSFDVEYVSYDVESLFTNIPADETTSYIINKIFKKNKLQKICSKIFNRLLYKSTTEVLF